MAHKAKVAGKWRKRFLSAMARTANAGLSAQMAGVDKTTAFALRKRDPGFAAAWVRARDWGRARVKSEGRPAYSAGRPRPARPGEAPADARALIVRRSKREGAQIVRAGEGRWSPAAEADFFAWLAAGFGVSHAVRQIGFSTTALYQRRLRDPDFAARWAAVREEGLVRNDELLIDSVPRTLDPEVMAAAEGLPKPTIAEAIQIQRLYRRKEEEGARGRRKPGPPPPSAEEVTAKIVQRVGAIKRHREAQQLAQGWVRDEHGNMIPPGWERRGVGQ